jgi:hypothetical protein
VNSARPHPMNFVMIASAMTAIENATTGADKNALG